MPQLDTYMYLSQVFLLSDALLLSCHRIGLFLSL